MTGLLPSHTGAFDNAGELPASIPTFAHALRAVGYRTVLAGKMHFIGPDQLHGFEERWMPDIYPAGLDWVPDWRLGDDERLPWYHDLGSVLRAGPVRATLQLGYDAQVAACSRRAIAETARMPGLSTAARKPRPPGATILASVIGSPATKGSRATQPAKSSIFLAPS